jgi:hypothetical protein
MSSKRAAANRANAKRSTGPRTAAGKSRSRQNAFKHGLAVPVSALPELTDDVLKIAYALAGEAQQNPHLLEAAVRVAEAAVDVLRVRRARVELLSRPAREQDPMQQILPGKWTQKRIRQWLVSGPHPRQAGATPNPGSSSLQLDKQAEREITLFEAAASQLEKLDRYERRSLSRRDRAFKSFDEIKATIKKHP